MGRRQKILLQWVLCLAVVAAAFACFGSKGSLLHFARKISRPPNVLPVTWRLSLSASSTTVFHIRTSRVLATFVHQLNGPAEQGPAQSVTLLVTPDITRNDHGAHVAALPVETVMDLPPIKSVDSKGSVPKTSPTPHKIDVPLGTTQAPSSWDQASEEIPHAPAPQDAIKPITNASILAKPPEVPHSPAPVEALRPPNATAPPTPHAPPPDNSHIPGPSEAKKPPNATTSAPASSPQPLEVSHAPTPDNVGSPPNAMAAAPRLIPHTPTASHRAAPDNARRPSNTTPSAPISIPQLPVAASPAPDVASPPNKTIEAPFSSPPEVSWTPPNTRVAIPNPSRQPPESSHSSAPGEASGPPNTTTSAPISSSAPSESSHSPAPREVRNPPNTTASAPISIPTPAESSHSPAPGEARDPPNATTSAPISSSTPSESSHSPAQGETKNPPSTTASSPNSHPRPPETSHVPSPEEARNPPNATVGPKVSPAEPPAQSSSAAPKESQRHSNGAAPPVSGSKSPEGSVSRNPVSSPGVPTQHTPPKTSQTPSPLVSPPPLASPARRSHESPLSAPMMPPQYQGIGKEARNPAAGPTSPTPASSHDPGVKLSPPPVPSPEALPKNNQKPASPHAQGPSLSPSQSPFSSNDSEATPSPAPMIPPRTNDGAPPVLSPSASFFKNPGSPTPQPSQRFQPLPPHLGPAYSPVGSHSGHSPRSPVTPSPQPRQIFPPPPPTDCASLVCTIPFTNTPPGAPCACVQPMKVMLRLGVELYPFFPLVSELAEEVASGVSMNQSQVRIMGANAASEDTEKTVVLLDIVPFGYKFDMDTALSVYDKFWNKEVPIKSSYFGDYDVIYVIYPGLPPSPPTAPTDFSAGNGIFGNTSNGRTLKPLGVDVPKRKGKLSGSVIAIIILSSIMAMILVAVTRWLVFLRHRGQRTPESLLPSMAKSAATGIPGTHSSTSASFSSSIATYTGSLKTFSLSEIEMATDKFHDSKIIGEGGFGRVYQGTLEDESKVAVKVLKRDDQQGGREFLAEVEMLSRLHHRNLVKLLGICTDATRCLVYELIPNGSVESHLHGADKETAPLDWNARTKIALGAARGLAYLHEDSSPRVIHRDFKSSNILLEHDFTPKVSDFGLARTALDEGNEHISTRVMGTFGYVAPEYAMTGHLLVKSDVYSYGVVLLELLTGKKPVNMLQPPGQENLVAWARPLLTSKEGLEVIIDPALGRNYPSEDVAKVAAIASMCVQPEVSHRPFMGEVVQALKLVCNEGDENKGSGSCSQDYSSAQDTETRTSAGFGFESERMLSASDVFSTSARFTRDASNSLLRHSSSGPLTSSRGWHHWQKPRGLSVGSMSDHDLVLKFGSGLDGNGEWL